MGLLGQEANGGSGRTGSPELPKKKAAALGRFHTTAQKAYFGAGVVVLPELFLDFLPPLWLVLFLVLLVFAGGVVLLSPAPLSVDPPPACANDRLAPSSSVNAIVSSFFISLLQSPSEGYQFFGIVQLCKELFAQHFKQRSWKRKPFSVRRKKSGLREAAWGNDK
jgi:hypothetical protein